MHALDAYKLAQSATPQLETIFLKIREKAERGFTRMEFQLNAPEVDALIKLEYNLRHIAKDRYEISWR